ncbi:hypothetical protein Btru_038200 [Bulinus truncatus]|nr:hypothetical protein Btru_038200 [Bulinus truncatus]
MHHYLLLIVLVVPSLGDGLSFSYFKHWIGVGYDLVKANPSVGNDASQAADPGFYPTRRILSLDGANSSFLNSSTVEWDQRVSCSSGVVERTFYSGRSYQQKLLEQIKVDSKNDLEIQGVSFTESDQYKRVVRETTGPSGQILHEVSTQCIMGTIRYKTELLDTPLIETAFAHAVCALPFTFSLQPYIQFIQNWGTHVVTGFDYGYSELKERAGSKTGFIAALLASGNTAVKNTGVYQNYTESYTIDIEDVGTYNSQHVQFGEETLTVKHGDNQNPEPLTLVLLPISDVVTSIRWDTASLPSDCPANLATLLPQFGTNLKNAVTEYAKTFTGPTDDPTSFVTPLGWPSSQFGLLQPKGGCSNDGNTSWEYGSREFTPEFYFTHNDFSSPLNLAGEFNNHRIVEQFCVKTSTTGSPDWPKGSYCVHRYGSSCPADFRSGWVYWDDEDGSDNHDKVNGTLPAGEYGADTKMYFCCRYEAREIITNVISQQLTVEGRDGGEWECKPRVTLYRVCKPRVTLYRGCKPRVTLYRGCKPRVTLYRGCKPRVTLYRGCKPRVTLYRGCKPRVTLYRGCKPRVTLYRGCKPRVTLYRVCKPRVTLYRGCKPRVTLYRGCKPRVTLYRGCKPRVTLYRGCKPRVTLYRGCKPSSNTLQRIGCKPRVTLYRGCKPRVTLYRGCKPRVTLYRGCKPRVTLYRVCKPRVTLYRGCKPRVTLYSGCKPRVTLYRGCKPRVPIYRGCKPRVTLYRGCKPRVPLYRGCKPRVPLYRV